MNRFTNWGIGSMLLRHAAAWGERAGKWFKGKARTIIAELLKAKPAAG
jgi:hypothetical protein